MNAITALIAKHQAAPKQFAVVTRYADGNERRLEVAQAGQAETHAIGERRKIGRSFIDRDTHQVVTVVSVEVVAL
jgi:hypothetical protein